MARAKAVRKARNKRGSSQVAETTTSSLPLFGLKPSVLYSVIAGFSLLVLVSRLGDQGDLNALSTLVATYTSLDPGVATQQQVSSEGTTANAAAATFRKKKKKKATKPKFNQLRQHPAFDPSWDIFQRIEAEQTGRVVGPRTEPPSAQREANFVSKFSEDDAASAAWLQRTNDFMVMELDGMKNVFTSWDDKQWKNVKMTTDWLDFGVEHLSKWWELLKVYENNIPFRKATETLKNYIRKSEKFPVERDPAWKETIAVVAYEKYLDEQAPEKHYELNMLAVAAAVESLRRAGFGRVVVASLGDKDDALVNDALKYLAIRVKETDNRDNPTKIGNTEVAFVVASQNDTGEDKKNIGRAAAVGLRKAFQIAFNSVNQRSEDNVALMKSWLGETQQPGFWKYVYLTEYDNILQTRPTSLPRLKAEVDAEGGVVIPHRFLPIPHESDVEGALKRELFIWAWRGFEEVMEVDALALHPHTCCDDGAIRPGLPPQFPDCGNNNPWYLCDLVMKSEDEDIAKREHERLKPYKLIRLIRGTGLAFLAGNEAGRRCTPHLEGGSDVCVDKQYAE